ncbi:SGNH/GDSL hydrolase family protein [Pantoea sp. C2G6]|uniref:SGNH/GDSL hydrolase family protein n=1 Tax=Pantoea sp. C2G6 TaxID=3243084 RepID=UPI003EDA8F23
MPHFDYADTIEKMLRVTAIVLVCASGLIWLNQHSLNQYWAVHFHRESPWRSLVSPLWKQGASIMRAAESAKTTFIDYREQDPAKILTPLPEAVETTEAATPPEQITPAVADETVALPGPQNERQLSKWLLTRTPNSTLPSGEDEPSVVSRALYDPQGKAVLGAGKKVLMIGDSMMEGVAPRVLSQLQKDRGIAGLNLSRRNTGLAYPGYFNWPETTRKALENDPDIGLLVVFLGPNDPWSMPDGPGKPYLKFKSEAWENEYRNRIRSILALAQQHTIPVIWLLPPNMRSDKLSQSMAWLNRLYSAEVKTAGGIVLSVNEVFGYKDEVYSPVALIDGKTTSLRAPDGTHYSLAGQKLIAQAILENIAIEQSQSDNINEE